MAKVPVPSTCTFSAATGLTTCVTVSAEVFDHYETPTLADVNCTDANGDPSTRTQTRRDSVYRTDTTTKIYKGKGEKPPNLISTRTTSTYRTQQGAVVYGPCSDVTAPDTSITNGPSGSTSATGATFAFSSDEPSSTFACSLDGADFSACTSPAEYSGLAVGAHSFRVKATDAAGNVDGSPAERNWSVLAPPVVTITAGPSETTNSPSASFSFSSTQAGSYACKLDDGAFTSCTSPRQYFGLSAGDHTFTVKVTNANGSSTDTRSWTIEANLPICAAEVTSFSQLANGQFEVLGSNLGCLEYVAHVRTPTPITCQGGGTFFNKTSSFVVQWTDTRIVFNDSVAAGQWSICIGLAGEFDGLEGVDVKDFDYADFIAGPDPFNVSLTGVSSDGLHFSGSVAGAPAPVPGVFEGATFVADLSHGPVTGTGCVPASGTWSYSSADGTLVHFVPQSASFLSYCPTSTGGFYFGLGRVVATSGDLLTSSAFNVSFRLTYNSAAGTFTGQQYGLFSYTEN